MIAQVSIIDGDYVVMAKVLESDGCSRFRPIINFGQIESDAREFAYRDIMKFDDAFIRRRSLDYDKNKRYRKVITSDGKFKLEMQKAL